MKRILFSILVFMTGISSFAQITDIKYLVNKTPQEMVALYDNCTIITGEYYDYEIDNTDFFVGYYISNDSPYVAHFIINSNIFSVFSDYINGGIRIGDSLERLQSIDFTHTPYGRSLQGNGLHQGENNYYYVYSLENAYFCFEITDGIIVTIIFKELEDCDPNNINPYSPFGN